MLPTLPLLAQVASMPFKRSQTGLFHGKVIQFGNNVPFSKHKTRRTWLPNIQQKGLRSEILNKEITIKVSTKALKTIKKCGGIDQYILRTRSELLGPEGMRIRIRLRDRQQANALQAAKNPLLAEERQVDEVEGEAEPDADAVEAIGEVEVANAEAKKAS
ncbi:hypothetical protein EW145_g5902 [Phellinidium pouzarii]|uniref:Large ribosomal subunit protein bL28m n=1 Tax=Phellinidium pouzarii TaxID=167371 RepID=A0A4S4L358_9AGAM|nr:hypothetical protein EW145_g5902 [Phellinidium pouzarii]